MLQLIADFCTYNILRLPEGSKLGESVCFFIYDSIKILLLLFVMISVIGFIRSYISRQKIKGWLSKKNVLLEHFSAAAFGALTPFCSCSSIPIFLSFMKAGVPLGPSFSFLITSPLINEYLVVLMLGFFGIRITVVYVVVGMIIGIVSGMVLGKMKLENNLEKDFRDADESEL
ncbi:permease, partial [Candidatus Margulisiibacteriota bacterium]